MVTLTAALMVAAVLGWIDEEYRWVSILCILALAYLYPKQMAVLLAVAGGVWLYRRLLDE